MIQKMCPGRNCSGDTSIDTARAYMGMKRVGDALAEDVA